MLRRRTDGSLGNAIIWFGASYAATICGYLGLNAVAGRWLGPADFGQFVVVLTATGLLGQLGLVGVHRSGLREAARLEGEDDRHALVRLRNGVRAVHLTTLPFVSALGVVGAWVLSAEETTPVRLTLSCSVGVLVLLTGQQKVWANYLRGFGHYRLASLVEGRSGGALVAVSQAGLALALWRLFPALGLAGVLGAVAAGYAIPVLAARQVVRAHWRHQPGDQAPQLIADMRAVIRRDWRFLSVQIAVFLNISIEVWIAALLLDAVDTSMYTAGLRLAQLLILPMTAIQVVFSPTIARLMVQEDRQRHVERILRTGASLASLLTVAVAVPMVVAPRARARPGVRAGIRRCRAGAAAAAARVRRQRPHGAGRDDPVHVGPRGSQRAGAVGGSGGPGRARDGRRVPGWRGGARGRLHPGLRLRLHRDVVDHPSSTRRQHAHHRSTQPGAPALGVVTARDARGSGNFPPDPPRPAVRHVA